MSPHHHSLTTAAPLPNVDGLTDDQVDLFTDAAKPLNKQAKYDKNVNGTEASAKKQKNCKEQVQCLSPWLAHRSPDCVTRQDCDESPEVGGDEVSPYNFTQEVQSLRPFDEGGAGSYLNGVPVDWDNRYGAPLQDNTSGGGGGGVAESSGDKISGLGIGLGLGLGLGSGSGSGQLMFDPATSRVITQQRPNNALARKHPARMVSPGVIQRHRRVVMNDEEDESNNLSAYDIFAFVLLAIMVAIVIWIVIVVIYQQRKQS